MEKNSNLAPKKLQSYIKSLIQSNQLKIIFLIFEKNSKLLKHK